MFYQVIAALCYVASFKPIGIWIAAPVAIALQLHGLRKGKYPELQAFIFAFLSSLLILSWSRVFVGVIPWILLALLQGALAIPLGLAARFTKKIPVLILLILLLEELRARFPFGGFSWTRIAFSQVDSPFSPLVAFTGMAGLSMVTLLVAAFLLSRNVKIFSLLLMIFIGITFTGTSTTSDKSISIRAVQGGVPTRGLEFNARAQEVLDNHIEQTRAHFSTEDDLIIWPENSIDIDPIDNREVAAKIEALTRDIERPLLAGAIIEKPVLTNATILFSKEGEAQSIYLKRYLTPFGEYIPMRSIAAKISPHVARVDDFTPGDKLVQHKISGTVIGSIICYELLNDGLVREAAKGSSFVSVHTNSATFSGSNEGEQQLAITRLRAIESGRSIVSISTTGPSAIIDARGEVLQKLADGEVGSLAAEVAIADPTAADSTTLANRIGGYSTIAVLLLSLMWALFSWRKAELR